MTAGVNGTLVLASAFDGASATVTVNGNGNADDVHVHVTYKYNRILHNYR